MDFTYFLPDENGNKTEHGTTSNAVIIIGANGSGKSKLGAWIEQQDMEQIHRIGAQRNLNFHRQRTSFFMEQMKNQVNAGRGTVGSGGNILPNW